MKISVNDANDLHGINMFTTDPIFISYDAIY